jgi:hypothetical protein
LALVPRPKPSQNFGLAWLLAWPGHVSGQSHGHCECAQWEFNNFPAPYIFQFWERWRKLNTGGAVAFQPLPRHISKLSRLLREITPDSDDDDDDDDNFSTVHRDPSQPWLDEFEEYYDSRPEILPAKMSMVSWWGVSHFLIIPMVTVIDFDFQACLGRFPTWRSLARD